MNRTELVALHDALAVILTWPPSVLAQVVQWLALEPVKPNGLQEPVKPNGRDPHPSAPSSPTPRPLKAKTARRAKPTPAHAAEQRLIAAMRDNPGLSVIALANAAGSSRSGTGERLRQMALRGVVEKSVTGRWKLKEAEPGPQQPSPS